MSIKKSILLTFLVLFVSVLVTGCQDQKAENKNSTAIDAKSSNGELNDPNNCNHEYDPYMRTDKYSKGYHDMTCHKCGTVTSSGGKAFPTSYQEDCTFENGICIVCEGKEHDHDWVCGDDLKGEASSTTHRRECTLCGKVETVDCEYDSEGICTVCHGVSRDVYTKMVEAKQQAEDEATLLPGTNISYKYDNPSLSNNYSTGFSLVHLEQIGGYLSVGAMDCDPSNCKSPDDIIKEFQKKSAASHTVWDYPYREYGTIVAGLKVFVVDLDWDSYKAEPGARGIIIPIPDDPSGATWSKGYVFVRECVEDEVASSVAELEKAIRKD